MYTLRVWTEPFYVNGVPYECDLYDEMADCIAIFQKLDTALDMASMYGWEVWWEKEK